MPISLASTIKIEIYFQINNDADYSEYFQFCQKKDADYSELFISNYIFRMEIHLIRHATIKIKYGNKTFLVDPWLMKKDEMPGFPIGVNPEVRQPRVELPISIDEIIQTDAVILTHTHDDHWDEIAAKSLNKNIPFFVQNEDDFNLIKKYGFINVKIIEENGIEFEGIKLFKTGTQHGPREIVKPFFDSINVPYDCMGVVFQCENQKTLYITGDSIWCDEVKNAIDKFSPSVIVANLGGVSIVINEKPHSITMDINDLKNLSSYAKNAKIIGDHMETTSHITYKREDVKKLNLQNVVIPDDNDIIKI